MGTKEFSQTPEHQLDLFGYWSICGGQAQPLNPSVLAEAKWYFDEIQRRHPGIKDEQRQAENREQTLQRTIEQTMVVLELCGLTPSSRACVEEAERFRPLYEELARLGQPLETPPTIINLPLMDDQTRESLQHDWYNLELILYLRERVAAKVTEAAQLQSQYSYSDLENIRKSTAHFIARQTPKGQRYVPERFVSMPCLTQLRQLENKNVLGKIPLRRVEDALRIIIAQQEDIVLPEPPSQAAV